MVGVRRETYPGQIDSSLLEKVGVGLHVGGDQLPSQLIHSRGVLLGEGVARWHSQSRVVTIGDHSSVEDKLQAADTNPSGRVDLFAAW